MKHLNPIMFVVFFTLLMGLLFLNQNKNDKYIKYILLSSAFTELITLFYLNFDLKYTFIYNISFIIHFVFWLLILIHNNKEFEFLKKVLYFFLLFSLINFTSIEKQNLNNYTFIVGALVYVIPFIYISFYQLKMENLAYFTRNSYILQAAPVLFFVGFTFLFAFRNYDLRHIIVYSKVDLYTFISTFVNVVYYGLINLYIFKERKQKNA